MVKEPLESKVCFITGKICLELLSYMSHSASHLMIFRDAIISEKCMTLLCLGYHIKIPLTLKHEIRITDAIK